MAPACDIAADALGIFLEGLLLPCETLLALLVCSLSSAEPAIHHYALANMGTKTTSETLPATFTTALPRLHVRSPDKTKQQQARPSMLDLFSEPSSSETLVRGLSYATDGKKVPAGDCLGTLLHVDLWKATDDMPGRQDHVAELDLRRPSSLLATANPGDTIFIVNLQVPGTPFVHVVSYWRLSAEALASDAKFAGLFTRFRSNEPEAQSFQDARFKLVPTIVDGPWLIKAAVPQKPAITGTKLTQRYFVGSNYVEVDMDIGSSAIASNIVSLCRGYAERLVVDLSLTLQGNSDVELPERIFGSVRFSHLDLTLATAMPPRSP
ncbi:hypothetical protein SPRG_17479 [Saprolegnia parasitica CBS 223.65]|uniref:Protein ENHANCED DISEASE RESISTANCE 2 C-terminal domain-containing protein n=1 Tax=Saprolegnia parasitica (strain CBS 223.65) TaxID=695850 RepID=A0A067BR04_SAPPC|nr:hypothetical protein SPRG_17479 [Saprolegnia parasitica CBS 223.65]KDO17112.1 hypothetical protein SPRG_17479 [Saprolegnia parasitica CBS 223.65]|eukprot:XP_012212181.1 hypothetical protein SPRG_17479 [Saprolegnia parasitica CBS 223.65]